MSSVPKADSDTMAATPTPKRTRRKALGLLLVLLILGISPFIFLFIQYPSLDSGVVQGTLQPNEQKNFRLTLDAPHRIYLALQHDLGNDFDLFLFDDTNLLIASSQSWLSTGESIAYLDKDLPAGQYRVSVKAFEGSGAFSLRLFKDFLYPFPGSQIPPISPFLVTGSLNQSLPLSYAALYLPSVFALNVTFTTSNPEVALSLLDGYGSPLAGPILGNTSLLLTPYDQYRINLWVPSNWVIFEVDGSSLSSSSFSLDFQYSPLLEHYLELATNTTPAGRTFTYHYFYEYEIEVPPGTTVTELYDAIPLMENRTPYLVTQLLNATVKETETLFTNYSLVMGRDGQQWVGFHMTNLSAGKHTLVFQYRVTDLAQRWDLFDTGLGIADIPSEITSLWTRSEGHRSFLEIPSNLSYFRDLAIFLTQNCSTLNESIQALFEYTVHTVQYAATTTPVLALINQTSLQGNCHTYSTLFISLARAAGIPAREAAGVGILNSYETDYHGWVEIYYPNYGWVPVDPTWLDTSSSGRDIGPTETVRTPWYASFQITGSHIRFTYWLQSNGTVWWSYGPSTNYLGSPAPENWLRVTYTGIQTPAIYRGFSVSAAP